MLLAVDTASLNKHCLFGAYSESRFCEVVMRFRNVKMLVGSLHILHDIHVPTKSKPRYVFIQINHQPDATIFQFIILTFVYSSTCFGRFPAHHQELSDYSGSLWFYLPIVVIVVLCS